MSDQTPTPGSGAPETTGTPVTPVPAATPAPVAAPTPAPAEVPAPTPGMTPAPATPAGAATPAPDPVTASAPAASAPVAGAPVAQPGAPGGTPPAATAPTGQPPAGGSPFKGGKQKIIMMVVGGVAIVGGLGALAGLLGGGDKKIETAAPGEAASGILNPSPIGNVDPQPAPGETTAPAQPTPVEPVDPVAPPAPAPPAGGGVSLGGLTNVPLPAGWEVLGQGDADLLIQGPNSSWVYALVGVEDPSADAGALVTQGVSELLTTENYSQLQLGTVTALPPFGSLVSIAYIDYEALWADAQSAIPLHGQLFVGVRQDGSTLVMTAEHSPPEEFDASRSEWGAIIDGAFNTFGAS